MLIPDNTIWNEHYRGVPLHTQALHKFYRTTTAFRHKFHATNLAHILNFSPIQDQQHLFINIIPLIFAEEAQTKDFAQKNKQLWSNNRVFWSVAVCTICSRFYQCYLFPPSSIAFPPLSLSHQRNVQPWDFHLCGVGLNAQTRHTFAIGIEQLVSCN